MWETITKPFAWLMVQLYEWTGNYGLSVLLFAFIVNVVLSPFMAKSKKSSMRTTRLQPKIKELQKRHEGNQKKLNEEMQKLYREEGINPMSGCIWSLIPFPILIALYSVIRQPLSRMMFISKEAVTVIQDFFVSKGWYTVPAKADAYYEINLANILHNHWDEVQSVIKAGTNGFGNLDFSRLINMDFSFLGMNLGNKPEWRFWLIDFSDKSVWLPALLMFAIPLVSALMSFLSMKVSAIGNPQQDAQTEASMKSMTMMMPIMSIWFCFIMPAAMGIYWIGNSVFGMARDFILTRIFKKQLDAEDFEKNSIAAARERQLELNKIETERKHAEGTNEINSNTSKKKIKANEKQSSNERKAALEKEEKAARREMLGIEDTPTPASQSGNRKFARGRAYDPDRFANNEKTEESNND